MLLTESYWYKKIIEDLVTPNSLVIVIGSSTKTFREKTQPHINTNIYQPLAKKNCKIINVDLKDEEGVDLSGDITQPDFIAELQKLKADLIICSNLLEHILDRDIFIHSISAILKKDGLLVVSVPYSYPYHSDPIDTLYRPSISGIINDFRNFQLMEGKIVKSGMLYNAWYGHYSFYKRLFLFLRDCLRAIVKLNWKKINLFKWLFIKISVTCCVLKKI